MLYNKQLKDLIQSEINDKSSFNCAPSTIRKSGTETTLTFEASAKKGRNTTKLSEKSDVEKHSGTTTTESCTSSTDSGVNISDNDEIPPSPTTSHSFPSTTSSSETSTEESPFNQQFHNNNNNNKNTNTKRDNNVNIKNNNIYNHIFNVDNDGDHNDDDNDVDFNSTNFDNKLKSEQHCKRLQQQHKVLSEQLIKVGNNSNEDNNTRYQSNPNRNIVESENVIEVGQQQNFKTLPSKATPILATTTTKGDIRSLQHNESINPAQRPASTTSSLSMSSIASSYDDNNPPSKMHHCNGSPVVSIRSINSSTIITSDSDSDSDLNSDIEGVHENYVIKKLGTQVSYPPNHPNIPNINSGQKILNQKVIPNGNPVPPSPLATLAAIGDSIGAAQALGPVPSISAVAQRPQIGSIALSNSSDVTFGDKHFYEGPVTIQQFLIDGRDKWKESNENDNPTFVNDNAETSTNNAKDINSSAEQSGKIYGYIIKRKKLIIPGVLAFMALLIVATILGSRALNDSKNTNNNNVSDEDICLGNRTLCLIDRDDWRAHQHKNNLAQQKLPLHRAIISHTASEPCESIKICAERVRVIQEFHMNSLGWNDIGYNFLISSDGHVYVGRGWDAVGAHTKGYNYDSVGITFIGTYMKTPPTEQQLQACLLLLEEGVRLNKLASDYRLYGARQFAATESPGDVLYKIIKKWPHWSIDINPT